VLLLLVGAAVLLGRAAWPRPRLGVARARAAAERCAVAVEHAGAGVECLSVEEAARDGVAAGDRIGPGRARGRMAAARMAVLDVPLDLDRAPAADLESLPGIGPELAARIVAARPFPTVEAVGDVPGIGPKRFSAIVPRLFLKGCENCIAHGAGR
jgi:hypothetical protein